MSHWNHYLRYVKTYSRHSHYHETIPLCQQIYAKAHEKITRMFRHRGKRKKNNFKPCLVWKFDFSFLNVQREMKFLIHFRFLLSMCWPILLFFIFAFFHYSTCSNVRHFHSLKLACILSFCLLSVECLILS